MAKRWPFKDPDEVLDYGFDWSPRDLGEDYIVTTTADVVSGDVEVMTTGPDGQPGHRVATILGANGLPVKDGQGTKTWLEAGTLGTTSTIVLHAITHEGRELDQTITIKIKAR